MRLNLPPLNAIRAFEAAGRCRSFTNAAAELGVTTGAISRQMKILEQHLGVALFQRGNREVQLTLEGQAYLAQVFDALRRIDAATAGIKEERRARPLRIMCCVSLASRWLFPRLHLFYAKYPQARLSFSNLASPYDSPDALQNIDVLIRANEFERSSSDYARHHLFDSELVAVCSPKLLASGPPLKRVADLHAHTLLMSQFRPSAWTQWFEALGETAPDTLRLTRFESSGMTYQAAAEGLGVALGEWRFVREDVEKGVLAMPFSYVHASKEAFYLMHSEQIEHFPYLREFRKWMIEQAQLDNKTAAPSPAARLPAMREIGRRALAS